jgi:hypothetical protein
MDLATVQRRIEQLEKLEEEVRVGREMLKSELENELSYLETVEEVKAAVAKRKQIKDVLLATGSPAKMVADVKENLEEISTLKEILSAELMELYQESNSDEIAGRKFKVSVRLLPKKTAYDKRNTFGQYIKED